MMLKKLLQQKLWPMLLASSALSLSGCVNGPMVTVCVSAPKANHFSCYNQNEKKNLIQSSKQVDNWIFLSAADESSTLNACKNGTSAKVNVCVFSASTLNFACFNEVTGQASGMTFSQSENYIGVSPVDMQILLTYCASLKH